MSENAINALNIMMNHVDEDSDLHKGLREVAKMIEQASYGRDEFMEFFRSEDFHEKMSVEDCKEVFCKVLHGSSDFTKELLEDTLSDYDLDVLSMYSDQDLMLEFKEREKKNKEQQFLTEQNELLNQLAISTLTPGVYRPTTSIIDALHMAVFVGDTPIVLTGDPTDPASVDQAKALSKSVAFSVLLKKLGYKGMLRYGTISGGEIDWKNQYSAIVSKESGKVEDGTEEGPLMAMLLTEDLPLTTIMCVDPEIAKAIDPLSPLVNKHEYDHPEQDEYEGMERLETILREIDSQLRVVGSEMPQKTLAEAVQEVRSFGRTSADVKPS